MSSHSALDGHPERPLGQGCGSGVTSGVGYSARPYTINIEYRHNQPSTRSVDANLAVTKLSGAAVAQPQVPTQLPNPSPPLTVDVDLFYI